MRYNEIFPLIKNIPFPDTKRGSDSSCAISCIRGMLSFYGYDITDGKLKDHINQEIGDVIIPDEIVKSFNKIGFDCISMEMTVDTLKGYIDRHLPVMVLLQAWSKNPLQDYGTNSINGHWCVVIGYNDRYTLVEDPFLLNNHGYITWYDFNRRWYHETIDGVMFKHWGIVVLGEENFEPEKMIKIP